MITPPPAKMPPVLNKIVCGDNCDVLCKFPRDCIDLVVTSPPYDGMRKYGGNDWDFYGVAWNLARVLKPGGVVVWVVDDQTIDGSETGSSFSQALHFKTLGLRIVDTMVWEKTGQGAVGSYYWSNFEFMFVLAKGKPKTFNPIKDRRNIGSGGANVNGGRNADGGNNSTRTIERTAEFGRRFNVWRINQQQNSKHPAPFPQVLAADHIRTWSAVGDIVLDPFNGSGTTTRAAYELKRKYIGIEVNPAYCKMAEERMKKRGLLN